MKKVNKHNKRNIIKYLSDILTVTKNVKYKPAETNYTEITENQVKTLINYINHMFEEKGLEITVAHKDYDEGSYKIVDISNPNNEVWVDSKANSIAPEYDDYQIIYGFDYDLDPSDTFINEISSVLELLGDFNMEI